MNILVECSSFFAAPHLAECLGANLYVLNTKYNEFHGRDSVQGIYAGDGLENIGNGDLIVIGATALLRVESQLGRFRSVKYIACDSGTIQYMREVRRIARGMRVYAMPDLAVYLDGSKPIYQYLPRMKGRAKGDGLVIGHSPRTSRKVQKKGTRIIQQLSSYPIKLITGLPMEEALREKGECHVFIDQLITQEVADKYFISSYRGGIGKSGLEAMILGCAVITSGDRMPSDDFPPPPIVYTDEKGFVKDLDYTIDNRERIVREQSRWLRKYMTKKFFREYLCE